MFWCVQACFVMFKSTAHDPAHIFIRRELRGDPTRVVRVFFHVCYRARKMLIRSAAAGTELSFGE